MRLNLHAFLYSPSPFKILLRHLFTTFPTPSNQTLTFLACSEILALFTELLGAKSGELCINGPQPPALIQARVLSLCPQEAHSLVLEMQAHRICSRKRSDMEERPPSVGDALG